MRSDARSNIGRQRSTKKLANLTNGRRVCAASERLLGIGWGEQRRYTRKRIQSPPHKHRTQWTRHWTQPSRLEVQRQGHISVQWQLPDQLTKQQRVVRYVPQRAQSGRSRRFDCCHVANRTVLTTSPMACASKGQISPHEVDGVCRSEAAWGLRVSHPKRARYMLPKLVQQVTVNRER